MNTHPMKLVTIVSEALARAPLTRLLAEVGAHGYTVAAVEDTPVTFDPRGNDSDVEGDALNITAVNGQAIATGSPVTVAQGTISLGSDGRLTFTPAADYNGSFSLPYTIGDGHGHVATATVTVQIVTTPVNQPPVAQNDAIATPANTPVVINVLANDSDPDGDALTIIAVTARPAARSTRATSRSSASSGRAGCGPL